MDLAGFWNFRKHCFESSCWTWFIDVSLADGVERQIAQNIQSGWWTWLVFGNFESTVLNQVAGFGLLMFHLLMV